MPRYVDVEIANLKVGFARGYSAPQSVVRREIRQISELVSMGPEKSPFYSPGARSTDSAFQAAFRNLIRERIDPALRRYRDYLQDDYLPKARVKAWPFRSCQRARPATPLCFARIRPCSEPQWKSSTWAKRQSRRICLPFKRSANEISTLPIFRQSWRRSTTGRKNTFSRRRNCFSSLSSF